MDALADFIELPAPAKLNLFLHITGRRADGYHLLQTVFQFLDYADTLILTRRNDGVISRSSDLAGVPAESDLTVRAARLLQQEAGVDWGVDIHVEKCLPMGGGLGGGSSDAATVLHGCNKLWGCHFSNEALSALGLKLGADVPVFIHGFAAWAEGIGEELTAIDLPEPWYLVIHPGVFLSTAQIFSREGLTRDCEPLKIRDFLQGRGFNVFENEVRNISSDVSEALDWLDNFAPSRLTGTGSCLFASFPDKEAAEAVLNQLPVKWQGFVARGLNISPLNTALQQ